MYAVKRLKVLGFLASVAHYNVMGLFDGMVCLNHMDFVCIMTHFTRMGVSCTLVRIKIYIDIFKSLWKLLVLPHEVHWTTPFDEICRIE